MIDNLPDYIADWCRRNHPRHADLVFDDMIDVATGNREGNPYEREMIQKIIAGYERQKYGTTGRQAPTTVLRTA